MRVKVRGIVLAIVALAAMPLSGIYMHPETRLVPVARLAANLERQLKTRPTDADLLVNLARLYGMAYAMNASELPVLASSPQQVWFGIEPGLVPEVVKVPGTAEGKPGGRIPAAAEYLATATRHFEAALRSNPAHLDGRLGLAWSLEQAGKRAAAIDAYRRVIAQAWPKEQGLRFAELGQRFYTQEAAERLVPLLDATKDAAEIAELKSRGDRFEKLPRPITPIAIPLVDGATARSIVDLDARVPFDADGSGLRRQWTWITGEAGWLVYDLRQQGAITSALQWFGNVTFWLFWNNGYGPLAALDDNADGELGGSELRLLAIWVDANRNGISERGEVRPLADHGIVSLSSTFSAGDGVFSAAQSARGVRLRDGRTRPSYDVILRRASSVSAPVPDHE